MAEYLREFTSAIGQRCTGIELGIMTDCGEPYEPDESSGCLGVAWSVGFAWHDAPELVLTYGENATVGDPFYIKLGDPELLAGYDSREIVSVEASSPLCKFINSELDSYTCHCYQTNYPGDETPIRWMPWGIELRFSTGRLLVGALNHESFRTDCLCADELMVFYEDEAIDKMIGLAKDYRSIWKRGLF